MELLPDVCSSYMFIVPSGVACGSVENGRYDLPTVSLAEKCFALSLFASDFLQAWLSLEYKGRGMQTELCPWWCWVGCGWLKT